MVWDSRSFAGSTGFESWRGRTVWSELRANRVAAQLRADRLCLLMASLELQDVHVLQLVAHAGIQLQLAPRSHEQQLPVCERRSLVCISRGCVPSRRAAEWEDSGVCAQPLGTLRQQRVLILVVTREIACRRFLQLVLRHKRIEDASHSSVAIRTRDADKAIRREHHSARRKRPTSRYKGLPSLRLHADRRAPHNDRLGHVCCLAPSAPCRH